MAKQGGVTRCKAKEGIAQAHARAKHAPLRGLRLERSARDAGHARGHARCRARVAPRVTPGSPPGHLRVTCAKTLQGTRIGHASVVFRSPF